MAKPRFTRLFFSTFLLLSFSILPAFAKPRDLSLYTLRVHIFKAEWTSDALGGRGSGMANLYDGQNIRAIDFVYFCPTQYMPSVGNQAYQAKWKKPEKSLEILGTKVGGDGKSDPCEFKVSLHNFVYDYQSGTLSTFTSEQFKVRNGMALPNQGVIDTDPTHYPLRLSILQVDWTLPVEGFRTGTGKGNVNTPSGLSSVDFTTECGAALPVTPQGHAYAGRWLQESSLMTLFLQAGSGQTFLCTVRTSLHTDIYVLDPSGTVRAMSQEEYRRTHGGG